MALVDLPNELLILLPKHLANIEDYISLSSTCRALYKVLLSTSPNTILRLAAASARIFFRPTPLFLVAATARQISQWALLNDKNYEDLHTAFLGGMEGLFQLCVCKTGLSMDDIRRLHSCRFTAINPVSDMIDRCAGRRMNDMPYSWDGRRSDANVIEVEPERTVFQIIIYGELFGSTMDAILEPNINAGRFDLDMRLEFIKYCIPDWACRLGYERGPNGNPGMQVLPVGPYDPDKMLDTSDTETSTEVEDLCTAQELTADGTVLEGVRADQLNLNHLLGGNCREWPEAWEGVRHQIGPDFAEAWRQNLWRSAVQQQGLEGLEMLRPGGVKRWRSRLQRIRDRIEALPVSAKPVSHRYGKSNWASDAPCMADEILVCVAGYWDSW